MVLVDERGEGGDALPDIIFLFYFPCSADHKNSGIDHGVKSFCFGLVTNTYPDCENVTTIGEPE